MPAPNIDMIAASLRSCSLTGRSTAAPVLHELHEQTDESEVVTVELNSEIALPYHWEQCLDMRTGEIYYINWKDGTRTTEDPRSSMAGHTSYYSSEADDESSEEDDDGSSSDGGDTTCSSGVSSVSCSDTSRETLVAAGCKACFMYFMVPKHLDGCPKCGGGLLHLGRF